MEREVGVRELKEHMGDVLRRVEAGETVALTRHKRVIARLVPAVASATEARVRQCVAEGLAYWDGGKPRGLAQPKDTHAAPLSDAVVEDRR